MSSVSVSSEDNSGSKGRNGGIKGGGVKRGTEKQGELATKVLLVQSKRFFLDVKQNDRGRFIKFAELTVTGHKHRIFMSMRTANQLKTCLDNLIDIVEKAESTSEDTQPKLLNSATIVNDKRRYYVDLRANNRGHFLRVTQISVQFGNRVSVTMPSPGLKDLRSALDELITEYADDSLKVQLPEGRSLRSENKNFYFDPDQNDRGTYLKISEVRPPPQGRACTKAKPCLLPKSSIKKKPCFQLKPCLLVQSVKSSLQVKSHGHRSTITISSRALPQFSAILSDIQEKLRKLDTSSTQAKDKNVASSSSGGAPNVDNAKTDADSTTQANIEPTEK